MATIIFGLDGTLIDIRRRHHRVYADSVRELGAQPLAPAAYWSRRRAGEGTFQIASGLPGGIYARFTSLWSGRVEADAYLEMDEAFEGAGELLEGLRRLHKLVLVTLRKKRARLHIQMTSLGLMSRFETVISPADEMTRDKRRLVAGIPGGRDTWVVGDSEADLALAAALRSRLICVASGVRSASYLRKAGAECVVPDVAAAGQLLLQAA
jgi:phosphoglycolate phosphatase-like HAD superfamily hydrolase